MHISQFAVKRPVTVLMIVFIIILLGVVSLSKIGIDLFPEMDLPAAAVITTYSGAGPEEIETLVTKPIEEAIASVSNIEEITSETREGMSMVTAQFAWGTDMDYAALKMREKIDLIQGMLPDDVEDPMVFQFDPSMMPINIMTLSGSQGESELKTMAEDIIKPRLERLEGVASVSVSGGRDREIRIKLDLTKLRGYGLSPDIVMQSLAAQNLNSPGGTVDQIGYEYLVRTIGEFQSVDDIKNVLISTPQGGSIRLSDIATVEDGYEDINQYNFMNGQPTVGIIVQKQSGANTVKVADRINAEVKEIEKELPGGTELISVMDQSDFIKKSINNVSQSAVVGGILAIIIIYLFLRNLPSTLIIAAAMPISVIATFILVYFGGLTFNLMSLGGLALGVGMLVDNSIVVLENIYRHRQLGTDRMQAAVDGAVEVANPIIASTLTTLAVFLPIVYVEGLASQLFRELAMTVSFSLVASLAVSLTLIPMLSSKMMRVANGNGNSSGKSSVKKNFLRNVQNMLERFSNFYKRVLAWSLKHRIKTVSIALVCFIASLVLFPLIGAEFMPSMDTGELQIEVELPKGSSLEETKEKMLEMEKIIAAYDDVENLYMAVGASSQDMQMGTDGQSHVGQFYLALKDQELRKLDSDTIVEELRQKFKEIPGITTEIIVGDGMTMGSSSPINIEIRGDDFEVLEELGKNVTELVKAVSGTREVSFSMEEGRPEVQLQVKRDKAASYGLTSSQIATAVNTSLSGSVATLYRVNGDEVNVRVEAMDKNKENLEDLRALQISTPTGSMIPLAQVVEFETVKGPTQIDRDDQVRAAYVTADIAGRDLQSVATDINKGLNEIVVPTGYSIEFGGEQEDMQEAFGDLGLALILAVILVYMIMAAQFESLMHPLVIMFSVPLALVGAIVGLFITGRTFNVTAFIGIIMLAGIVVNNAIVMVDYINNLRREGKERNEAILEAGPVRLRPILMTALTTILAMVPMAIGIGEGAEARAPLATVVVGGLTLSTLLTLIVIPVMYALVDDFVNWFKRKFKRFGKREKTVSQ